MNEMLVRHVAKNAVAVAAAETAKREVESSIAVACEFRRDVASCRRGILDMCSTVEFAELAEYSIPVGGQRIKGPTAALIREMARQWGNIRYGSDVVDDDDETRTIRCWAWDLQSNTRVSEDACFRKTMKRDGRWKDPRQLTADDVRYVANRHSAFGTRNCLEKLLPPDLIIQARQLASETVTRGVSDNPEHHKQRIVAAYAGIGVTERDIETRLGKKLAAIDQQDIIELRRIYASISDGHSSWSDYVTTSPAQGVGLTQLITKGKDNG